MPSATAIATKKKGSADKPSHAHLRRFNVIYNYVNMIIKVLLMQVSCWRQHCFEIITNYVLLM